jgi:hypothetical protein
MNYIFGMSCDVNESKCEMNIKIKFHFSNIHYFFFLVVNYIYSKTSCTVK